MNVTDKYPLLIGHFPAGRTELHSMQEVADFICTHGLYDDLLITTADGEPFISTFGIYIDRIADMGYRKQKLEENRRQADLSGERRCKDGKLFKYSSCLQPERYDRYYRS